MSKELLLKCKYTDHFIYYKCTQIYETTSAVTLFTLQLR